LSDQPSHPAPHDSPPTRRSFFTVASAVVTGAIAVLTPLGVGLASFFSPLRRRAKASSLVRVALLEQVPDDGTPRAFPVLADRVDAWNRYPAQRIGAVYLVRNKGDEAPVAFTAKCPHAGCFIGYTAGAETFQCPCHTSAFKLDGTRARGDAEVAPRDMDELEVELVTIDPSAPAGKHIRQRRRMRRRGRPGGADRRPTEAPPGTHIEVWVEFVDFQTGRKDKVATA
jgi:menaquinol-cytochrome c reductase iron-sulfur subunit